MVADIWNMLRFGTALRVPLKVAGRLGILVHPYYWIQEGVVEGPAPQPAGRAADYAFSFFGLDETEAIARLVPGYSARGLSSRLERGQRCLGARYRGQIAAFMWCDLGECGHKWNKRKMGDGEVYLFDMYTLKPFRGRNIAPCLRHHAYQALRAAGCRTFYSISEFFNHPAIRFKRKLNAQFLWVGLYIELFGKRHWRWVISRCDSGTSVGPAEPVSPKDD